MLPFRGILVHQQKLRRPLFFVEARMSLEFAVKMSRVEQISHHLKVFFCLRCYWAVWLHGINIITVPHLTLQHVQICDFLFVLYCFWRKFKLRSCWLHNWVVQVQSVSAWTFFSGYLSRWKPFCSKVFLVKRSNRWQVIVQLSHLWRLHSVDFLNRRMVSKLCCWAHRLCWVLIIVKKQSFLTWLLAKVQLKTRIELCIWAMGVLRFLERPKL